MFIVQEYSSVHGHGTYRSKLRKLCVSVGNLLNSVKIGPKSWLLRTNG